MKCNIVAILILIPVLCFAQERGVHKHDVFLRLQKTVQVIQARAKAGTLSDPFQVRMLINKARENLQSNRLEEASALLDKVQKKLGIFNQSSYEGISGVTPDYSDTGSRYEKIIPADLPLIKNGIADPSLEYGPDGTGWMVYSHVDFRKHFVSTYLAKSEDNGKTWEHVQIINQGGATNKETSTLVYDPDDPGKEWKLFYFEYIHTPKGEQLDYSNSWISYKYTSNPQKTWSKGIPILGPPKNKDKGLDLVALHPDLKDFIFFYELGSLYLDGVIYLSLEGCASATSLGEWEKRKIILISSSDHGKTWKYNGTLIDYNDARDAGYLIFTASSLVKERDKIFLLVSPSGKLSNLRDPEGHHDGTHIFEFENISKAKLRRDRNGKLILIKHIDDNLEKGGQADYDEQNSYGGIVIPQQDKKYYPEIFQLFSTKQRIVNIKQKVK